MIETIDSLPTLVGRISQHYWSRADALAKYAPFRPALAAALQQPRVKSVADYAEVLWAARAILSNADRALLGQLAHYAARYSLFGFHIDERGLRMTAAMRRDLGEAGDWPSPDSDPEPIPGYAHAPPADPDA